MSPALRFLAVSIFLFPVVPLRCQSRPPVVPNNSQGGATFPQGGPANGSITVYLRDDFGEPILVVPQLRLTVVGMGMEFPSVPQQVGTGWTFSNLSLSQEYQLEVKAEGYQTAHEDVTLPPMSGATENVIVFMRPIGQKKNSATGGQMVLAPRAQKEVDRGLKDLRARKFDSAQRHLSKALGMVPASPYVNYLAGMVYLLQEQIPEAEQYLAKSVSLDPREPAALLALGTARLRLNDNAGAIQALEQDVQLDAKSWKAEWMLANAYLREREYSNARDHAQKAVQLGKANAAPAELILGQAQAGLGDRDRAIRTFDQYLQEYPKDENAEKIREYVEKLKSPPVPKPEAVAVSGPISTPKPQDPISPTVIDAPPPTVDLPPKENWAPADVDASQPFVIPGAACSLPKVLKEAARNAEKFASTLEQFSATEEYESVEIKRDERLETPDTRRYNYLAMVNRQNPNLIEVDEFREARSGSSNVARLLDDFGTPGLALAFHPIFNGSFDWSCEGLGEWKGKAAWVVHFEQKKDRPTSLLQAFETSTREYALPLKGRAWVSQNGGEVMHLDTDLTRPMKEIGMLREHFSIDYGPIVFRTHKVELWLPQDADVYYQYQNHYIHHYHHYSDFKLFWVGTIQKDSKVPYRAKKGAQN